MQYLSGSGCAPTCFQSYVGENDICVSQCRQDVLLDKNEKLCVSCAEYGLFRHPSSAEELVQYYCTECREDGHFVHSDGVCNTTSCADEPYAFFVEEKNGVSKCTGVCTSFAIGSVGAEEKDYKC